MARIHLAIVVPVFVWEEAEFWRYTDRDISYRLGARVEPVLLQEEMVADLDPCHWFDIGSPKLEEVGAFANLPTALATGWHEPCFRPASLEAGLPRLSVNARRVATSK